MKKIIFIGFCTVFIVISAIIGFQSSSETAESGTFQADRKQLKNALAVHDGEIVHGKRLWEKFKKNSSKGKAGEITILQNYEGGIDSYKLEFDGEMYLYYDEDKNLIDKRKYLVEVNGKMPNAEGGDTLVVITDNDQYSYEEITKSTYSSQIQDHIEYEIILWLDE